MIDSATLIVFNIIVWDGNSGWIRQRGIIMLEVSDDDHCSIGSKYDQLTKTFSTPPSPGQS